MHILLSMCVQTCSRSTLEFLWLITFLQLVVSINAVKEPKIMFEVNGFYLDDMLTYSPTRFGNFSNSITDNFSMIAAEANRPQELQCPSMNVISTRYRCKVFWLYGYKPKEHYSFSMSITMFQHLFLLLFQP